MAMVSPFDRLKAQQNAGYQTVRPGLQRKRDPDPSGYIDETIRFNTATGPQTATRRINPNQNALDTERARAQQQLELERQQAEEARRYSNVGGYMPNTGQPPQPTSNRYSSVGGSSYVEPPIGGAMAQPEVEYEDYVDEAELQRLIALARGGFKGTPEMREEDFLDEGLLSQLQQQANQQYQFTPEEYFDDPKARALGFNRSKDNIGLVNRSALDALRDEMAATGRLGSGIEAQLGANILGGGAQQLSQFETDQAMEETAARRAVGERNANRKSSRDAQLAGLLPSLASQARKTRLVPGDPGSSMRQQEAYLAGLMPQLLKQAQKKRPRIG